MNRFATAAIVLAPVYMLNWSPAAFGQSSIQADSENSAWLAGVADQELIAVDGSKLTLSPMEGRLDLGIVFRAGAEQKSVFRFLNAELGTVSDDTDKGEISGFFRQTDVGLEIQYGDGRTASLVANTADGLTLTRRMPTGESGCMSWYPAGHVFSAAERRAAVEAYAERLGVSKRNARKRPRPAALPCAPAMHAPPPSVEVRSATIHTLDSPVPLARAASIQAPVMPSGPPPVVPVPAATSAYRSIKLPFTTIDAGLAPSDAARLSIFVADFLTSATSAISVIPPTGANSDAAATYFRNRLVSLGVPRDHIVAGTRTPAIDEALVELDYLAPPSGGVGASSCLGVDAQNGMMGFRNHCGFTIQYSYCLEKDTDPAIACDKATKQGDVSANGFASLIAANDLHATALDRDFRWIACRGEPGTIVARLEHADPPTGHCERTN